MKIVVELNHPKHYYQFKYVMQILKDRGHIIQIVARDKDVLLKLLDEEGVNYKVFGVHKQNILMKFLATMVIMVSYYNILIKIKPDLIISKASLYSTLLSKVLNCKSIIFPDSEVVTLTNKIVAPLADKVITPETFELNYGKKHIKIPGFFEDCYLHPSTLKDDSNNFDTLNLISPYVILRFIGWSANHDLGKFGISTDNKVRIVELLKKQFNIYISSEKSLPDNLKKYELKIPASSIHQVLHHAVLYIGDSQTMATEAALLGTPSIRTNSFVGPNDMSNFKILEFKYKLLRNVGITEDLFPVIEELSQSNKKNEWLTLREAYFSNVGNSNLIIADLIEKEFLEHK